MGRENYRVKCQEPLTYPYGCVYTSIAQLLIIVAWSLSLLTISSCYFINARPIPGDNEPVLAFLGYGFMVRQGGGGDNNVFGQCGRYTDFQQEQHIEAGWRFATAFGFLALLIGGLVALILLTTCCMSFQHDRIVFTQLAMVTAGCFFLQILVFCAYGNALLCGGEEPSDYICEWGSGSGLNLGAALLWLLSAFLLKLWPVPDEEPEPDLEEPRQVKQNFPMLTMGQKPAPKPQELPKLTNGPTKKQQRTNLSQLTNEPHKPKRPSSRPSNKPLQITADGSSQGFKSPKGNRKPSGRQSRRVMS